MEPITFTARKHAFPNEASVDFSLQLVGSLPVHSLTTMPMLPWVVAEVRRLSAQASRKEPGTRQVRLCVSPSGLRCEPEPGKSQQWDPLICSSIFECKPQHVHKLIHNSHDPSYFACLIKDNAASQQSICYVFKADDQTKSEDGNYNTELERFVPEGDDSEEYRITVQMFLSVALLHLVVTVSKFQTLVSFCYSGGWFREGFIVHILEDILCVHLLLGIFDPILVYYVRFHVGSHSVAMTQCMAAWNSVSASAHQHLTVCHARQELVAGCKGWQGFFFIYKKNVPDCVNSEVFVGGFGFMTRD